MKTIDIYFGALPFLAIQILMVAILIVFPGIVTRTQPKPVDTSHIDIVIPQIDVPPFK